MNSDVSAIGRKSLGVVGLDTLGTGTIVDVFQREGTLLNLRDDLKMLVKTGASCSAQFFKHFH